MTKLLVTYDRLLVKQVLAEEITQGGIIIPLNQQEPPLEGYILQKGEGRMLPDGKIVPIHLDVGDRVLFGRYAGADVVFGGEKYKLLKEDDVLGVVVLGDE